MIIGLGNPGKKYSETRHNVGFKVVESLAEEKKLQFISDNPQYQYAMGVINDNKFALLLPMTFMNNSGEAVFQFKSRFDFKYDEMLVIVDDINLPLGNIRLRAKGSDGGHNGLFSIIQSIQSKEFPRLRIGIGNNFEKEKQAEYVLSPFNEEEKNIINKAIKNAVRICNSFINGGLKSALECYSRIKEDSTNPTTNSGVAQ